MPVKNLLFDLGGVIIDLHIQKTREAFEELGLTDAGNWFVAHNQAALLNSYETGTIDTDTFIRNVSLSSGLSISEKQFRDAWNAMLGKVRWARVEMLRELREKYRVYALSNINALHAQACHHILQRDHDLYSFHELFDRVFYSHEIHARKPDPESWQAVIASTGILPEETLFFDDNPANILAAEKLGFQTHLVDLEITDLVEQIRL